MGLFSKDIKNMNDLFVHTLQDIYYAEKQIVKALPDMVEKSSDPQLKQGFQTHLRETENHVKRLEPTGRNIRPPNAGILRYFRKSLFAWEWVVSQRGRAIVYPPLGRDSSDERFLASPQDVYEVCAINRPSIALTQHSNQVSTNTGLCRGETRFCRAETKAPKRPLKSIDSLQRQNARTNPRQFGAFHKEPGNLRFHKTAWWGWEDSNLQPNDYQPPALSIEHSGAVS